MRIGIDIMGGDFAPDSTVSGVNLVLKEIPETVKLVLFGDKESIIRGSDSGFDFSGVDIVETTEVITMNDHPYKAFFSKKNSSIYKGFHQLKTGQIDAFCSAGNTGAMMIGATQVVTVIPGIIRPSIAARIPNLSNTPLLLLDVGLNPDSRPDVLYQYGILGKTYAKNLFNIEDPKIGLINIGSEEEKGNLATKAAYQLMKDAIDFNFIGNVEGNEIFTNPRCNVLVCDGFIGNVILKEAEGFYNLIKNRNITDDFFELFNFENFGGTPILGVCKPVVVGHGISNDVAIKNMILHTLDVLQSKVVENIKIIANND
ncbi:MAG: phosphate acyltransferase [Bacteroidales bacterium]|nr:phosphate acyltransferase [Bacteroidales bacterium]MCF8390986.1 phosphate acyltransferase [Bacteroidales bacterium]